MPSAAPLARPYLAVSAVGLALLSPPALAPLLAQSAYVPSPGAITLTPLYSFQRTREFHALGDRRFTLSDPLEQHTLRLDFEYGLAPGWALDGAFGWSRVHFNESQPPQFGVSLLQNGQTEQEGLMDTHVGIRRQLLDETATLSEYLPTVALRAGAILAGTYEVGYVNSVGDGASGFELGLLAAKSFPGTGTALFGDLTGRVFNEDVPDALEGSLGVSQQIGLAVITFGARHLESLDGLDILGPGFITASGFAFSAVREVNTTLEFGVSVPLGPVQLGLGYARTIAGENTPRKQVFALSAARSF